MFVPWCWQITHTCSWTLSSIWWMRVLVNSALCWFQCSFRWIQNNFEVLDLVVQIDSKRYNISHFSRTTQFGLHYPQTRPEPRQAPPPGRSLHHTGHTPLTSSSQAPRWWWSHRRQSAFLTHRGPPTTFLVRWVPILIPVFNANTVSLCPIS